MKKYIFLLIAFSFILFGCEESVKALHSPSDFIGNENYQPAQDCDFGSLVKPTNLDPGSEETITDPSPDLTWDFSGCADIWEFTINVKANSPYFGLDNTIHDDVLETSREYTNDTDYLQDCTIYYWQVVARGLYQHYSDIESFRTDFYGNCPPVEACTDAPPQPIAISPSGNSLAISNPQLLWMDSEPGCAVENYHYELAHDAEFTTIILEGDTTAHSYSQAAPFLSDDCSYYFFRVTATANGISKTSNTLVIGTSFTGGCMHPLCDSNELTPPTLVLPAEGSTVYTNQVQFLWTDNVENCYPDLYTIMYGTDPEMKAFGYHTNGGWNLTTYVDSINLKNCATIYWQVVAWPIEGEGFVKSEIGSFQTDFGNVICGLEYIKIPVEMVKEFDLGCVSANQMWAIYDFKGPVFGEFEARAGGRSWPCQLVEGTNNRLMCFGPLAAQQTELPVELFLADGTEPLLTLEGLTPQCSGGVVTCQPPAEGCSPIIVGRNPEGYIYAPTHWDSTQCACVP